MCRLQRALTGCWRWGEAVWPQFLSQINKLKLWGKASNCFLNRLRFLVSSLPFGALSLTEAVMQQGPLAVCGASLLLNLVPWPCLVQSCFCAMCGMLNTKESTGSHFLMMEGCSRARVKSHTVGIKSCSVESNLRCRRPAGSQSTKRKRRVWEEIEFRPVCAI